MVRMRIGGHWWDVGGGHWWDVEVVVAMRAVVIVGRWQQAADMAVVRVVACCWAV